MIARPNGWHRGCASLSRRTLLLGAIKWLTLYSSSSRSCFLSSHGSTSAAVTVCEEELWDWNILLLYRLGGCLGVLALRAAMAREILTENKKFAAMRNN